MYTKSAGGFVRGYKIKTPSKGGAKLTKEQMGDLILSCERQLYLTAKTILSNDQDCADAISETIVKAFSKFNTVKNAKYAKTWLIRILINESYQLLRKSKRLILFDEIEGEFERPANIPSDYTELYEALDALKPELKLPVMLYYIEDFSIRETAEILDISEGTVQKRLVRARKKLRIDLTESEAYI